MGALGNPEELWSALKTIVLDVASGCLGTHCQAKKNFVSQGTLYTIDQSHRAKLSGRAELWRELRCKPVRALRWTRKPMHEESVRGVEHNLWSSDSHPT